ncbi:nuclear transport factor 2 family protein [Nocardia tengchongensis]|uniref:nuclear transport factor 2 family protein n=1 Tax=Nocardia tengchongensis TaxID=2055889 RepID=UPI00369FB7F4
MTVEDQVRELCRRWAAAEQLEDVAALNDLTVPDFTLVGPAGFVLDKGAWLDRYRGGALRTTSIVWEDHVTVRDYGAAAIAIGRYVQEAEYQGNKADGRFRSTHVAVERDGRWLLAGLHLSTSVGP